MKKHPLIRLIALVLIPCLMADPITAAMCQEGFSCPVSHLQTKRVRTSLDLFQQQAVVQALTSPLTPLLGALRKAVLQNAEAHQDLSDAVSFDPFYASSLRFNSRRVGRNRSTVKSHSSNFLARISERIRNRWTWMWTKEQRPWTQAYLLGSGITLLFLGLNYSNFAAESTQHQALTGAFSINLGLWMRSMFPHLDESAQNWPTFSRRYILLFILGQPYVEMTLAAILKKMRSERPTFSDGLYYGVFTTSCYAVFARPVLDLVGLFFGFSNQYQLSGGIAIIMKFWSEETLSWPQWIGTALMTLPICYGAYFFSDILMDVFRGASTLTQQGYRKLRHLPSPEELERQRIEALRQEKEAARTAAEAMAQAKVAAIADQQRTEALANQRKEIERQQQQTSKKEIANGLLNQIDTLLEHIELPITAFNVVAAEHTLSQASSLVLQLESLRQGGTVDLATVTDRKGIIARRQAGISGARKTRDRLRKNQAEAAISLMNLQTRADTAIATVFKASTQRLTDATLGLEPSIRQVLLDASQRLAVLDHTLAVTRGTQTQEVTEALSSHLPMLPEEDYAAVIAIVFGAEHRPLSVLTRIGDRITAEHQSLFDEPWTLTEDASHRVISLFGDMETPDDALPNAIWTIIQQDAIQQRLPNVPFDPHDELSVELMDWLYHFGIARESIEDARNNYTVSSIHELITLILDNLFPNIATLDSDAIAHRLIQNPRRPFSLLAKLGAHAARVTEGKPERLSIERYAQLARLFTSDTPDNAIEEQAVKILSENRGGAGRPTGQSNRSTRRHRNMFGQQMGTLVVDRVGNYTRDREQIGDLFALGKNQRHSNEYKPGDVEGFIIPEFDWVSLNKIPEHLRALVPRLPLYQRLSGDDWTVLIHNNEQHPDIYALHTKREILFQHFSSKNWSFTTSLKPIAKELSAPPIMMHMTFRITLSLKGTLMGDLSLLFGSADLHPLEIHDIQDPLLDVVYEKTSEELATLNVYLSYKAYKQLPSFLKAGVVTPSSVRIRFPAPRIFLAGGNKAIPKISEYRLRDSWFPKNGPPEAAMVITRLFIHLLLAMRHIFSMQRALLTSA